MAVFDTAHRDLYVACTGDSRAVAGVWEPSEDGKGRWRVEVLSEDQTGRNPSERARSVAEQFCYWNKYLYLISVWSQSIHKRKKAM
jgi:serine/threonine protein phosphatase PrpC